MAWAMLLQGPGAPWLPELRRALAALAMAVPVALAGFWLFPRLATPLWGLPENSVSRAGLGDRMTPNEWLDELVDDSPALRARFIGTTPPREQMYWRGPVLMNFDGEAWTRDVGASHAPAPTLRPTVASIRYEVMLEATGAGSAGAGSSARRPANARLNGELTAISESPINNLIRYQAASAPSAISEPLGNWQRRAHWPCREP
jgi:transglutaminase-like putative cysteine protease